MPVLEDALVIVRLVVAALDQESRTDECKRRIRAALEQGDLLAAIDLAGPGAGLSASER